jgi:hypothetical protein
MKKIEGGSSHPLAKMGWPTKRRKLGSHPLPKGGGRTTPFLAKWWLEPPLRPVWWWSNHPHGQEGGPATPKRPKKKKGFELLARVASTTPIVDMGVTEATPSPWWWSGHLQKPKTLFFFFFFWPFGGGRTTTLAMEGGSTTCRPAVEATPFWPRRWLRFSSFFLSFFF